MGCDIHMFCEFQNDRGQWQKAGAMFPSEYAKKDLAVIDLSSDGDDYQSNEWLRDQPYQIRNYDVFAWLADVRNGSGFAGCDTGDAIIPLAEPRGLPTDVSAQVKKLSDDYGIDGHSHSYFTLAELLFADTSSAKVHRAYVTPEVYKQWKGGGSPYPNCGGVSGGNVVHLTNQQMDALLASPHGRDGKSYYTQIEWSESQTEMLKGFMEAMQYIVKFSAPEKARVVFWFDN